MIGMKKYFFIVFIVISFFTSCKSTKNIQSPIITKDTIKTEIVTTDTLAEDTVTTLKNIYSYLQNSRINISTFSAKIDVTYNDGEGGSNNVTAHIRMQYDSIIWFSVTGLLGLEGVRGLITHDSVKLIDKQKKIYKSQSISYLQEIVKLPLDLVSLQDLILGNPVFWNDNISSFNRSGGTVALMSIGNFFTNLLTVNEDNNFIISSNLDEIEKEGNRKSFLGYTDYENKKGINFSTNRIIRVTEKKVIDIELEFKQYNFNETLSFPFNVPKNYKLN